MTTSTVKARFTLNFFKKTIEGTKASFDKASKGCGDEYEELIKLMNAHPDFECVAKVPEKHINRAKKTYKGLSSTFIKDYISIQENSKELERELDNVIAFYEKQNKDRKKEKPVFHHIRRWFLNKFDTEEKPFDMDDARKEIANSTLECAKKYQPEGKNADKDSNSGKTDTSNGETVEDGTAEIAA